MEKLLVSVMRLSAALTLYGMEQVQSTVSYAGKGESPFKAFDEWEATLNSLSDALTGQIGEDKKTTLESMTSMAEDLVSTSFDGVSVIEPRQILRATDDLIRASSETVSGWVERAASADGDQPRPAADVLA